MSKGKLVFLLVLTSLMLVSTAWAESITLPDLWEFKTARSNFTWTLDSSELEQTVAGVFISQPPASLQFIPSNQGPRITQKKLSRDHS